jgi:hypothetical protein
MREGRRHHPADADVTDTDAQAAAAVRAFMIGDQVEVEYSGIHYAGTGTTANRRQKKKDL